LAQRCIADAAVELPRLAPPGSIGESPDDSDRLDLDDTGEAEN
jgi:hypothetical protein